MRAGVRTPSLTHPALHDGPAGAVARQLHAINLISGSATQPVFVGRNIEFISQPPTYGLASIGPLPCVGWSIRKHRPAKGGNRDQGKDLQCRSVSVRAFFFFP